MTNRSARLDGVSEQVEAQALVTFGELYALAAGLTDPEAASVLARHIAAFQQQVADDIRARKTLVALIEESTM